MYDKRLDTFLVVADCNSFNKAAETLFLSGVSVMKQINSLEADLGLSLFARTNHGVRLTAAGYSIYEDAKS